MASLKIYYSSGSSLTDEFGKDPSESIGGIITDVEVKGFLNNVFRSVSHNSLAVGGTEYRILFLKNISVNGMTNLKIWHKVPKTTEEKDPSALSPSDGDEYIVPTGAVGVWADQDGKKATYDLATTSWSFSFTPAGKYRVGFISPIDIDLNEETLSESFVDTLGNQFSLPFGVELVSVDDVDGTTKYDIGDGTLASGKKLGMVIERKVEKRVINNNFFPCPEEGVFNHENMLIEEQEELFEFSYDIP